MKCCNRYFIRVSLFQFSIFSEKSVPFSPFFTTVRKSEKGLLCRNQELSRGRQRRKRPISTCERGDFYNLVFLEIM